MNRDWTAPASSSVASYRPDGGGLLFRMSGILYITPLIAMQCSMKFFAERYLWDTYKLSSSVPRLLLGNDRPVVRLLEIRRHEK